MKTGLQIPNRWLLEDGEPALIRRCALLEKYPMKRWNRRLRELNNQRISALRDEIFLEQRAVTEAAKWKSVYDAYTLRVLEADAIYEASRGVGLP